MCVWVVSAAFDDPIAVKMYFNPKTEHREVKYVGLPGRNKTLPPIQNIMGQNSIQPPMLRVYMHLDDSIA